MESSFVPKQAISKGPHLFNSLGGFLTERIAGVLVGKLLPLPDQVVLHDNACGFGSALNALFAQVPPTKVQKAEATELNPLMVPMVKQAMLQHHWPVTVQEMDSEKLAFSDDVFTHSITNFGLPLFNDPTAAAKEIYRTLKPGGTAAVSWWSSIPQGEAVTNTNKQLRNGRTLKTAPKEGTQDVENLKQMLATGGFEISAMKASQASTTFIVDDVKYLVEGMWTMVGEPADGWTKEDEDQWDEAIKLMTENIVNHPGYKDTGPNTAALEVVANILIVQK